MPTHAWGKIWNTPEKKFFFLSTENPQKFCIIKLLCDMLEIIYERDILLNQLITLSLL